MQYAALVEYCQQHSQNESPLALEIRQYTETRSDAGMLSGPVEGQFLALLVQLMAAKNVMEIGTFTGYSALYLATALAADGRLVTIDHCRENQNIAQQFLRKSPAFERIEFVLGDGLNEVNAQPTGFDLVFLDADKERYPEYYHAIMARLRVGGLLVVDNALWSGHVLKPEAATDKAIAQLNRLAYQDARAENVLLTVRDGLHLIRKVSD